MKKLFTTLLLSLIMIFSAQNIFASHFAGADLTYTNIGGNSYKVSLSFYRDCSGIAAPTSVIIYAECASNTNFNFTFGLSLLSGSGQEITNVCSEVHSSCSGGSNSIYGIREYVYQAVVTLPPCADWLLYYSGASRNPITTLTNTFNWFVPIYINNLNVSANSAPVYYNKIIPTIINQQIAYLDYGGVDPDGDSLVYSFYTPMSGNTSLVIYTFPFDSSNFLSSSTPISLDSHTGIITCTPNSVLTTLVGIRIDQWRNINGNMMKIGSNYRDLNLKVISAANSHPPKLSGMDFSNSHTYNANDTIFEKEICANQMIDFDINIMDVDSLDTTSIGHSENTTISWDNGINGATFTSYYNNTDSTYAHFSWIPTNSDTSANPKCFNVIVADSACPYYNVFSKRFCFLVKGSETMNLNISTVDICSDSSVTLIAQTSASNPNYIWKWNSSVLNIPQNTDTFLYIASNYQPNIDTISVTVMSSNPNGCDASDYAIINNIYQPELHISDTAFCVNDSIIIDAGNGTTYEWKDIIGNIIGTNNTQAFSNSGIYNVYVDGGINSQCFDRDTFYVLASLAPVVDLGNDTTLQPYHILTLDAGSNHSYIWSTGDTTQTITIVPYALPLGMQQYWVMVYDLGCPAYDTININLITRVNHIENKFNLDIIPNPNSGNFILELNSTTLHKIQDYKLEIYSVEGALVYNKEIKAKSKLRKKINLQHLNKGVYFVKLSSENGVLIKKMILK